MTQTWRFSGHIAGWGTESGTRVVVGRWDTSPLGAFADVMVEHPDGERVLLAPTPEVADLVATTYRFDRVEIVPVSVGGVPVDAPPQVHGPRVPRTPWHVTAGPLTATLTLGRRTALGTLLHLVPRPVTTSPRFTALSDPLARVLLHGVRTRGTAGGDRVEHYGASDVRTIVGATTTWDGQDLGALRPVDPPVRFGFGSAPEHPAVTRIVTTIVSERAASEA
ncbi:hypothetical protein [Oerskovia flava]|uniref:hypothetical protein n=1 Tax=Oerskovia flava TaxID=2986422 RepID=UPI002240BEC0|nr:hypothetical protein [Oerskovia sp. JB1-3-2]